MSWKFALFAMLTFFPSLGLTADEGKPAPEFQCHLQNGEHFTLSARAGQVTLLHFWASWCEPCQVEMPVLEAFYKKHQKDGLEIIAVDMDSKSDENKAREIMKKYSFPLAYGKDATLKGWGRIWRLPLSFLIDRHGILRKDGWVSKTTLSESDLDSTIVPLLKEDHGAITH